MSAGRYLHAIDPGLDELVIAVFDVVRYRQLVAGAVINTPHPRAMVALEHVGRVKTAAGERPADRAQVLPPVLLELQRLYPPLHTVVESPTNLVPYGGHTGQAVAQLALSIGVVIGVLEGRHLSWSPITPDRKPAGYKSVKDYRREQVHRLCDAVDHPKARSQDVIDAQWVGIRWLAHETPHLHRWLGQPRAPTQEAR